MSVVKVAVYAVRDLQRNVSADRPDKDEEVFLTGYDKNGQCQHFFDHYSRAKGWAEAYGFEYKEMVHTIVVEF